MSPEIARRVVLMFQKFAPPQAESCRLSPRELEEFDIWVNGILPRFLGVDLERRFLHAEPNYEDFENLGLDPAEERILHLLEEAEPARQFISSDAQEVFSALAGDEAVRREALALYYRYLRHGDSR